MRRKLIEIDSSLCNGCGLCVDACHEGAISIVDGKAKLTRDDCCDGLGDCLPSCPTGAISFLERIALGYNADEVKKHIEQKTNDCGCPGGKSHTIERKKSPMSAEKQPTELANFPVQIKLLPVNAAYFNGAHLLVSADCAAYAYGNFHADYMRGKVTLIGCPKLDGVDYTGKLTEIIRSNDIKSLTVMRMEVPCCGGIEHAAVEALKNSGKFIPWQVVTITMDGNIKN